MRRYVASVVTLFTLALLASCAPSVPTETVIVLAGNEILTADLRPDLSPEGVVLAAVLLVAGDVDKALSDGTVTQAEIDEARKAMDEGTLDLWRQRTEADGVTGK